MLLGWSLLFWIQIWSFSGDSEFPEACTRDFQVVFFHHRSNSSKLIRVLCFEKCSMTPNIKISTKNDVALLLQRYYYGKCIIYYTPTPYGCWNCIVLAVAQMSSKIINTDHRQLQPSGIWKTCTSSTPPYMYCNYNLFFVAFPHKCLQTG